MNTKKISKHKAQQLAFNSQGLYDKGIKALEVINQLSYVQIDTISVTERAHHHVIFSRNPQFKPEELTQLMDEKKIFEYWSHAAAYLPIKDFQNSLYQKEQYKIKDQHWFPRDKKVEKYVIERICNEGPLKSKDFENPKSSDQQWYEWKPAKIALTNLFMDGTLMIANREGFQKIFDLSENVYPAGVKFSIPSKIEYCKHLIRNAINSHGFASLNEISYLRKGLKSSIKEALDELVEEKKLIEIHIDGIGENYFTATNKLNYESNLQQVHILSPFDNVVIQRKRLKEIFDFDYQIECYVPEKKRVYGYYSMPITYGCEFVGRMDAKADRKSKLFKVNGIWFEKDFHPTPEFIKGFSLALRAYAAFCGCYDIIIGKVFPTQFKNELKSVSLDDQ